MDCKVSKPGRVSMEAKIIPQSTPGLIHFEIPGMQSGWTATGILGPHPARTGPPSYPSSLETLGKSPENVHWRSVFISPQGQISGPRRQLFQLSQAVSTSVYSPATYWLCCSFPLIFPLLCMRVAVRNTYCRTRVNSTEGMDGVTDEVLSSSSRNVRFIPPPPSLPSVGLPVVKNGQPFLAYFC